jgi:hypothetical protein
VFALLAVAVEEAVPPFPPLMLELELWEEPPLPPEALLKTCTVLSPEAVPLD